ncbi:MAG: ferric reductase-like transmembrane domain-containing protein, partial [Halofilum sp. (in: g-proteobacteria)]
MADVKSIHAGEGMNQKGFHPVILLLAYVVLALTPLGLAAAQGLPARPFRDELASSFALVGFSMMLMEFVLSGRFRRISGRIGIDITMRFHQVVARVLALFILIHPFLYSLPMSGTRPWDVTGASALNLSGAALITGGLAWLLLPVFIMLGIFRKDLPYRYEAWRLMHGLGAALIALLALHHTL